MEKILQIKGMSCMHCSARVEKALNSIDGVEAKVDLETNTAKVNLSSRPLKSPVITSYSIHYTKLYDGDSIVLG